MTAELEDSYVDLRFSPHGTAFLTDAIIMQRYIELNGQLQRIMAVVKVRGSAHSKDLRAFEITDEGIVMGDALRRYDGLLTGSPDLIAGSTSELTTALHDDVAKRDRDQTTSDEKPQF